jgi:hypothetical protein
MFFQFSFSFFTIIIKTFVPISIFSSITHHQLTFVPGYSPSVLTIISCTNSGGSG